MNANQENKGVLLLGFGGPGGPEEVEAFLARILGGRSPGPELAARVWFRYQAIGGSSPYYKITLDQATALEKKLTIENKLTIEKNLAIKEKLSLKDNLILEQKSSSKEEQLEVTKQANSKWKVYVGMGYWHPGIMDAVARMQKDGIKKGVAISLAPFYSKVSTGAYGKELEMALRKYQDLEIKLCRQWHLHPLFIEALAGMVKKAMGDVSSQEAREIPVVFTAHSLPLNYIEAETIYAVQAWETMARVSRLLDSPAYLAYQSKGASPGPWLEPDVKPVLADLSRAGYRRVIVFPFGFVSDHVETLYDLDIELRQFACNLGLEMIRVTALNDDPDFISALAEIAKEDYDLFFASGVNDEKRSYR